MQEIVQDAPIMPESDAPLKPIIDWYNIARERANAPSYQIEAHYFGISLPRLRNIIDVNQFDDTQIELLDKHGIDLNLAAAISQHREHWNEILTDDYLLNDIPDDSTMLSSLILRLILLLILIAIELLREDRRILGLLLYLLPVFGSVYTLVLQQQ